MDHSFPTYWSSGGAAVVFRRLSGLMLGVVAITTGCAKDPRISMRQFIEMQRSMNEAPAATQPSDHVAKLWRERAYVPYRVGPGDVVTVTLVGLNAPTDTIVVTARVSREGTIELPMAAPIQIGGLEVEDAEASIRKQYVPAVVRSLTVNVQVASYHTTDVLVVGSVTSPGYVTLQRTERDVLHAVAAAGGFSYEASGEITLQRVRNPAEQIRLDLLEPREAAAVFSIAPLESGDIVTVDAADPSMIFVGGLVNAPGPKSYPPGSELNLLQALAMSGGIREDVFPKEATLVRRMADGRDVQVKLDLDRLKRGEDPNIALAAGDIFWVPETAGTRFVDFLNRTLFFRAGVSVVYDPIQFENYRRALNQQDITARLQKRQGLIDPFGGAGATIVNPLLLSPPVLPP